MVLMVFFSSRISPRTSTVILRGQIALGDGGGDFGDVADLSGQVAGHGVDDIRQILPDAADALHLRLAAELAFGSDFARHARHFDGERIELIHHGVDGVLQLQNFAARIHRDFGGKIALGDGRGHAGDVADLVGQVAGHGVDALGEIAPGSGDAFHFRLAAELAFGSDFARHARHFRGERAELIHHRVDGVLQLQNFAAHLHGDFAGQVALGDGRGHFGDVANLGRQVAGHRVDRIRQILPGAADAGHIGLAAELAFGSDFARHARHFGGERAELVHHGVDGVLELQNFAARVDRDARRQVALGDGGGHFGDVANLVGQVAGHGVDGVRQILPHTGDALHFRLTAQLAFGSDFARHARHFGGERAELIHHGVDGVLQLQNFAARVHRDLGGQVAFGHGRGHAGDVANLVGQVAGHRVDALGQILPRSRDAGDNRLPAQLAFGSDFARHARHFGGERIQLLHHRVDHARGVQELAAQRAAVDFERHGLRRDRLWPPRRSRARPRWRAAPDRRSGC